MDTITKKAATPDFILASKLQALLRWETFLILIVVLVCVMNSYLSPYFLDLGICLMRRLILLKKH